MGLIIRNRFEKLDSKVKMGSKNLLKKIIIAQFYNIIEDDEILHSPING